MASADSPVLTLFAIPKPFEGATATRQLNAFRCWHALGLRIVVVGDEEGVGEAAAEVDALHVPEVERTELGTPLVSAAFDAAVAAARTRLLLYANADVLFLPGVAEAAARLTPPRFLAVGTRLDVPVDRPLAFGPGWEEELHALAARARPDSPFAMDWFLFPRDVSWELPPFAVGRPGWDGWLVRRALRQGIPVIDASAAITAVHQAHGYAHVPHGPGDSWEGPEAEANRALAGPEAYRSCVLDATHVLSSRGVRRARSPAHVRRRLFRIGQRHRLVGRAVDLASRARRRAR